MQNKIRFDWLDSMNQVIPPGYYAPLVFILWVVVLWLAKKLLVRRLRQWTQRTSTRWDDVLIEAISFPANFLILASGLVILINLLPLSEQIDRFAAAALQACVVIAAVLFGDRFLRELLNGYSARIAASGLSPGIVPGLVRGFLVGIGA